MPGEVSCRALRPLLRYLNERGIPLAELLVDVPLDDHDFLSLENWISEALFTEILDRAAILARDPHLLTHIAGAASDPYLPGSLVAQPLLAGDPEALLERAGEFLGLLQRDSRVEVRASRPGQAVIEWFPPLDGQRSYQLCTYARHLLAAIPRLWKAQDVRVDEERCAVSPQGLHLPSGKRYAIDAENRVWVLSGQLEEPTRQCVGCLEEDGTFRLGKTVYRSDCCTYTISWTLPQKRWREALSQFLSHFGLRRQTSGPARRQQELVQTLHEQIHQLNLRMEARVLERSEELRIKARQMALVEQAGRRFASILDPEALLQQAARTLREEFGFFTVALYLSEGGVWTLRALSSGDETVQFSPHQVVYAQAEVGSEMLGAEQPLACADLTEFAHPLGLPRLGRGRSSLTAPLVVSDRVIGALDLQSPLRGHFDQEDALISHTLATQMATTLERSRLYREERRARQQADAMAVLARVVTTSLELDRVLSLALDQLQRILPHDLAAIFLLEEERLRLAASGGLGSGAAQVLGSLLDPVQGGAFARLLDGGDPVQVSRPVPPSRVIPELGPFASWLGTPLTSRGVAIGAVLLASHQAGAYGEQDLRLMADFAGQVATAIENARLYGRVREERDRLETLYEIARELNADLEIEEVLRHIVELAQASVEGVSGSIVLLDDAGRPTHSILPRTAVPSAHRDELLAKVLERGGAGWVCREQKGLLVHDAQEDPRWLVLDDDPWATRSAVVVPLVSQGRVIGVLSVVHHQVGHFTQDDLALLTSVAGQASTVVQRASLFAAIRGERARLEAVIEGTADAVILLDQRDRVLRLNLSAAKLFELEPSSAVGRTLSEVVEHERLLALVHRSDGTAGGRRTEVPLADGRTFYATLTPIADVGAVITMKDITYLKDLEQMKDDFVATVSHDLRTPLSAILGFTEMLDLSGPLNEDQTRFVQEIAQTAESVTALVEDLLDLAKVEAGVEMSMAPCQMAAVIAELVDQMAGPAARKQLDLQVEVSEDLPYVLGNGRRLGQVIGNLLDNAVKFTPAGGRVVLRACVRGDDLCVDVSDNGPGIPAADLPHVFEAFFRVRQTAQEIPGTGLGLSIASSIVEAHHGRIWAESTEGEGATFSFCIPLWKREPGPATSL